MAANASNDNKSRPHFTYIWKIKRVPQHVFILSPEFRVQPMEMTKWCINLCLGVFVSFEIKRAVEDGGPQCIDIEFELSFLNTDGSPLIKKSGSGNFKKAQLSYNACNLISIDEIFHKRKAEFYPKDTLTIRCRIWRTGTEMLKSELCFASTHFHEYKRSCFRAIKGFSSLKQREKCVLIMDIAGNGCPQFMINLFLVVENGEEKVYVQLETPYLTSTYWIQAEIALLDAEGNVAHLEQTEDFIFAHTKTHILFIIDKIELMSNKADLLSDDVLVLRCELRLASTVPSWSRIEDYKLMDYPYSKAVPFEKSVTHSDGSIEAAICPFKEIVNKFRKVGALSDVCLRAGNKSFAVHKLILSSRSPIFRKMFTENMRERTSKCIDVPELEADTLSRLLLYIYEDKVQELTCETATNLFKAADRFELLALKEKCSIFLKSILSESNVAEILVLADEHCDESLQKSVQKFILNKPKVIYSEGWKDFKQNHSKLALETAEQIICNLKQLSG